MSVICFIWHAAKSEISDQNFNCIFFFLYSLDRSDDDDKTSAETRNWLLNILI